MRMLALVLVLILPLSAQALPWIGTFNGSTAVGNVTGQFVVDLDTVQETNVRNLSGNTAYSVLSWSFQATSPDYAGLPAFQAFSSDLPGDSIEYCVGHCVFSMGDVTNVRVLSATGVALQLTFDHELNSQASYYRVLDGPMAMINTGGMSYSASVPSSSDSVPEASSLLMLLCALPVMALVKKGVGA
jgi:hypothetical protein